MPRILRISWSPYRPRAALSAICAVLAASLMLGLTASAGAAGLTTGTVDVDLEKAVGWQKARFYVSAFDIRGHGPTRSLVGNNQIVSSLEATPSLKLYDLWLDQRLPGRVSIRLGQEGAND